MPRILRFDGYELDLVAGQLLKHGIRIRLREQPIQVLGMLLERAGQVVTREELRLRLWPRDVFVDFQNNLNTAIGRLRKALGDSAKHPRFVETLGRHGYRFIAQVSPAGRAPAPKARMLVLPFVSSTGDPAQEYISDSITSDVINELAAVAPQHLAVIARTTAMRYKGSAEGVERIGRELGVDYVVEGGMRCVDDRLRITVQLIRVEDQAQVFADSYDADSQDMFAIERTVAHAIAGHVDMPGIAGEIRAALAADQRSTKKPTEDPAAYDLYMRGRYHMVRLTPQALAETRQYFERALTRDSQFALAYDGLAEVYWHTGYFGFAPPREAFSTGAMYALRALELDNTLAETHALLGQYHKQLEYNWPEVEREMARAQELNPASPIVQYRHAINYLMPHGRLEEAAAELERALELDPLSPVPRMALAIVLVLWRRYERAIEEARRLLDLDPKAYWGYLVIGACRREQRRFEEMIEAQRTAVELSGGAAAMLGWLGLALGLGGHETEARAVLERLRATASQAYVPPTAFAWIYIGLGEFDLAFEWLNRAVEGCDQLMMPIKSYGFFDPIRDDPRFLALLRKMRLES